MKTAILLATYNSEKYLSQMLSSLLNQSFRDFVCYIHDDGSSDGTLSVIRDYEKSHPDTFVLMEDGADHLGAKDNFFHLLQNVSADVYFFADADDVWSKKKVEKSLAALAGMGGGSLKEAQTGMGGGSVEEAALSGTPLCIFTDMYVTDERLTVTNNSFIRSIDRNPYFFRYQEIIMDNPAAGCTMCFNRACRDAAVFAKSHDGEKRFKEAASQVEMHDVWVLLTAALTGRVSVIDEPLVHYRQHWDNEMGAASETFFQKLIRNAAGLFDGSIAAKKKAYYDKAKSLAGAALLLEGVSASTRETLRIFCGLSVLKKPERIEFLKEKGFRREKHSLWIWLWA